MNDEQPAREERQICDQYFNRRFQPHPYRRVFTLPDSGDWKLEASWVDRYFESASSLLRKIAQEELSETLYAVPAIFLCRHYLELSIKYALFHCRWLKDETENALDAEIDAVPNSHKLQPLWDSLMEELNARAPWIPGTGLDLKFVGKFVADFHAVDESGWRFRYPRRRIAIRGSDDHSLTNLEIDYSLLRSNLEQAHDILDTLDSLLVEQYGQNEDWESQLNSLSSALLGPSIPSDLRELDATPTRRLKS